MFPVGIDVSKNTADLCILYDGIKGRVKPVTSKITGIQLKIFALAQAPFSRMLRMFML